MEYEHFILNNVALCEVFMSMYQIRIDKIPDVILIDYVDLARYVYEYVDDVISQYASWCITSNKAEDIEYELRSKVQLFGNAYGVDMSPYLENWFEGLDKMVLAVLEDTIRQIHNLSSRNNVFKATVTDDGTIIIEDMGEHA